MPTRTTCVLLLLFGVSLTLPLAPGDGGGDLVQTVVQVGCLAVAWRHVLLHRHVLRLGWGLLVLAVSVLAVSDLVAALERNFWHLEVRPTPANGLALTGYFLLGAAVVKLDRNRSRGRRLPGGTEAAIFATGALTPLLVLLVIPVLQNDTMSSGAQAVTVAYALADLVIVTVIARLMLTNGGQSWSFVYLSAALFSTLAGDIWAAVAAEGPGPPHDMVRMLWLAGFVLFAAGIAHPSMETFISGGAWAQDAPRRRRVWLMGLGQAMPAVALALAWLFGRTSSLPVIAVGGLLVSVMVSARMNSLLDRISDQSSQLSRLARSDELTGLHNRRSWNFELERACTSAEERGESLNVALLDLDHFKRYNDSYGHPAGDRLLRAVSQAWQAALLPAEVLARYGGEEFAMLLPGTDLDEAVRRVDTLRRLTPGGQSFSAGVARWTVGADPEQTVADADTALYEAKREGRARVVPFHPAGPTSEPQVPYAMRTVVQPIVRVHDLVVVGYEALSRFDPSTDVEAVFSKAHEDGYGDVLEGSAILSALGLPGRPAEGEVFVNVSERAMRSAHFWQAMPARFDRVVVELHEQRDGLDDTTVARMLDRFRDRGARICLDDLVASQEDLDRIVSLRPDLVKIDRSLVAGCDTHPEQVADMDRLLSFARAYGVAVCAEGVETVAELAVLSDLGVPYVQGYLLGRPEPTWIEPLQPSLRVGPLRDAHQMPGPAVSETSAR